MLGEKGPLAYPGSHYWADNPSRFVAFGHPVADARLGVNVGEVVGIVAQQATDAAYGGALVVDDEMQSMLSDLSKFGASFVLATQSLAKLDDLSRTMRDTLLANVGCLAVFQVAGNDARALVWELGKERVTEDDITSLPVHHCYVRATDW